ncbi:phosphate ABC transporter membrane protein 1 (PhoT family) [Litorimonas taeanensis]|uniref:Phosphate transport system permease protein n=1 Tax=Litorimonas taeanensis TaxID=568099 RepID=A0A420WIB1_9PROT|nr:phosphate ABC transporter permease subunit PstC [Litorimonas taeanensis]RKQ70764.1 phosphate ABC transporter membrane protein 1 (PhoT family) [Litorimonas taeanensis]
MNSTVIYMLILMVALTFGGFLFNRNLALDLYQDYRFRQFQEQTSRDLSFRSGWHSQASYHGYFTACMVGIALIIVFLLGVSGRGRSPQFDIGWLIAALGTGLAVIALSGRLIGPAFAARIWVERFVHFVLIVLSVIAVLTTLGIIFSLLLESLLFFSEVSIFDFLFGLQWSPQTALRVDQAGQSGAFGAVPIFAGTFLIMAVAIAIAGPVGLMIAIYLSEYASKQTRKIVKPTIEILAGIPTVVYGFFALLTVGPSIRHVAEIMGFSVPTQSALAAGVVIGVMIIPLISSLSDDVINAVPQSIRDGAYALGATKSETMKRVVFAGALPGIISAFLLAISRAIGETMIVVMAAGRASNLTANPFDTATTVTVQIVALVTGDQEFDSPKTLAAFALGLVLFVITLILNMIALSSVRRYRERYD